MTPSDFRLKLFLGLLVQNLLCCIFMIIAGVLLVNNCKKFDMGQVIRNQFLYKVFIIGHKIHFRMYFHMDMVEQEIVTIMTVATMQINFKALTGSTCKTEEAVLALTCSVLIACDIQ